MRKTVNAVCIIVIFTLFFALFVSMLSFSTAGKPILNILRWMWGWNGIVSAWDIVIVCLFLTVMVGAKWVIEIARGQMLKWALNFLSIFGPIIAPPVYHVLNLVGYFDKPRRKRA